MDTKDIVRRRLTSEQLIGDQKLAPEAVVARLGAMQAQDYAGAKWALGLRTKSTNADIEQLFADGKILRTHMLRPTWHFVAPADIKWMQMLTAPRVDAFSKYYYKKLGLDDATFKKGSAALARALEGGKQLIRTEVAEVYKKAKIDASGLRLSYLIMRSELDALICSGAMRGKQHTVALVADRAPHAKTLSREEALAELTKRYFTSHGPAQIRDFAWWSSLTTKEINEGIQLLGSALSREEIDSQTYYFAQSAPASFKPPHVLLLPNYDEYLIAYKDHSSTFDPATDTGIGVSARYAILSNHIVVINGLVVGGWRRELKGAHVAIAVTPLRGFTAAEKQAIEVQASRYAAFIGAQAEVTFKQ